MQFTWAAIIGGFAFVYAIALIVDDARKRVEKKLDIIIDELTFLNSDARRRERGW